jgi:hypothetical protein
MGGDLMAKPLNYKEFMDFSLKHYTTGGDGYYECWDERQFNEYVAEFGPITKRKALEMYKQSQSIEMDMAGWY